MTNEKYEKIIREGERVDWYGKEVPKDLITSSVTIWSERLKSEIDKMESELADLRGSDLEKRKGYLKSLYTNLQNAPYSLNGDFYLIKKKRIELDMEQNKKEVSKKVKKLKKETTTKVVNTKTKNSDLIFGKKKK
jgi:hypothetical protein